MGARHHAEGRQIAPVAIPVFRLPVLLLRRIPIARRSAALLGNDDCSHVFVTGEIVAEPFGRIHRRLGIVVEGIHLLLHPRHHVNLAVGPLILNKIVEEPVCARKYIRTRLWRPRIYGDQTSARSEHLA